MSSSSSEKAPDFEPPQTSVGRIIKSILPSNVNVTKEARAAFTRAAGIFIFYLTHCANEFSREGKRTTISAQDIKNALRELDFEDFEVPLDEFLELYRQAQKEAETAKVAKVSAAVGADAGGAADMQVEEEEEGEEEEEEEEEEAEEEDVEEEEES